MHSIMHTMRMPQSMRTPTRPNYGDDGAFHVSAFDFDLILIFVGGAGLPIDMEYGISIWLDFSSPLERHFQPGDFDDSLFPGTACDESWAVIRIYRGLGQRCSVDQQHQHEKIYGL